MELLDAEGPSRPEHIGHPCWPLIWLWVLSISQYAYRYILQVNDTKDSLEYGPTPTFLSAIKYEIFLLFVLYSIWRLFRRHVRVSRQYRVIAYITAVSLLLLSVIFFLRLISSPGELEDTVLTGVQLVPWISMVFFIPLVFDERHSLRRTLMAFERLVFWIAFPFWLTTVALVVAGIRYPALSYPGLIVRFGGILDDPNANAGLSLFLLMLAVRFRQGAWKTRVTIYGLMLLGTLSFSGYIMAVALCIGLLLAPFVRSARQFREGLAKLCVRSAIAAVVFASLALAYEANTPLIDAVNSLYSAKANSTGAHISNLFPDEAMFDESSPLAISFGQGGYSENFYWRILVNFGWTGFAIVVGLVVIWTYEACLHAKDWRYPIGAWIIALLIASNGIAYVLLFPVSLLFWSMLSLLVLRAANPK
ncbi:MAG TPA: hypothetical protein VLI55_02085 [Bryobacteraceae bacterium]|nr:hypothetical protein [Bryobacteraceae bacterium]